MLQVQQSHGHFINDRNEVYRNVAVPSTLSFCDDECQSSGLLLAALDDVSDQSTLMPPLPLPNNRPRRSIELTTDQVDNTSETAELRDSVVHEAATGCHSNLEADVALSYSSALPEQVCSMKYSYYTLQNSFLQIDIL